MWTLKLLILGGDVVVSLWWKFNVLCASVFFFLPFSIFFTPFVIYNYNLMHHFSYFSHSRQSALFDARYIFVMGWLVNKIQFDSWNRNRLLLLQCLLWFMCAMIITVVCYMATGNSERAVMVFLFLFSTFSFHFHRIPYGLWLALGKTIKQNRNELLFFRFCTQQSTTIYRHEMILFLLTRREEESIVIEFLMKFFFFLHFTFQSSILWKLWWNNFYIII